MSSRFAFDNQNLVCTVQRMLPVPIHFLLTILLTYSHAQRDWRKVYLEDPKGILSGDKRMFDQVAEFTDLGYEYENGNIWPKPQSESRISGEFFTFDPKNFKFVATDTGGSSGGKSMNSVLNNALSRYQELAFPNKELHSINDLKQVKSLVITVQDMQEPLTMAMNESYSLTVDQPTATLEAPSVWGALRGLESFSQLVHRNGSGYRIGKTTVKDYPRFKYRGFLIDTSRHYLPVSKIYQILDALAYSKFNVLHWHIVDDPSFPYESKKFPELHKKGAFNPDTHTYKPEQVEDIIEYAKLRGIRVMPEFDTPGHTHSWRGIPGLLTECSTTSQQEDMFQDLKGPINPVREGTYEFLKEFFKEVSQVFPDEYIHLGGDEVDFTCWMSNSEILKWLEENIPNGNGTSLHTHFLRKLTKIVNGLDKKYIVWQEVFDDGVSIENDTVVNVWKEHWQQEIGRVTKAGYKTILSSCWYLNYIKYGLDWPKLYKCDPQDFTGDKDQKELVVGGSATMWGEYVDATNVIQRSFGRAFAVAERLWSSKDTRDISEALVRIWEHRCRYIDRGIPAEPVTRSKFCRNEFEQMNS